MKKNELKLGSALAIVTLVASSLIQIFYTPFYINYLGVRDYGINSLVQSIMGYMSMLNLGLGNAVLRYTIKYRTTGKEDEERNLNGMFFLIFSFLMILGIVIAGFIYIKMPLFFKESFTDAELIKTRKVFVIMCINLLLSFPMGVFATSITSREKFILQRGVRLVTIVLSPIIGVLLMKNGYGLIEVTISTVSLSVVAMIFEMFYALKLGMRMSFKKFDFSLLKEIGIYSFFIFLNVIIDQIYWGTDRIIIGKYKGVDEVAKYSIGAIFSTMYMGFASAISGVLSPRINSLISENKEKESYDLFVRVGRIQYFILALISSGFIFFGREFIELWVGQGYDQSYKIALWIMLPLTVPLIQSTGVVIMQAKNRHQFRSVVYLIIAILNVVLSIILVKKIGGLGCAVATGITFIFGQIIIMNIYYHKYLNMNMVIFWKEILKNSKHLIPAIVVGILLNRYIKDVSYISFLVKVCIYSGVYAFGIDFRKLLRG
nr:oligosaccharide flippase family protein [uncultured Cetobacterium sp.]